MKPSIRMPRIVATLMLLPLLAASPYSSALRTRDCAPVSRERAVALGSDWAVFDGFVQSCAVRGPDRRVALTVDVIRIDLAYKADFFSGRRDVDVPLPVIRLPDGRPAGVLPDQFPEDPPGRLRVRFIAWADGLPREISLYEAGQSALPPHPLPSLFWDPVSRSYR